MHGLYFIPALIIASLTPHSYAQFQSKATPVRKHFRERPISNFSTPSPKEKLGFHLTKLSNPHLRG